MQRKFKEAEENLKIAIRLDPIKVSFYRKLALAYEQMTNSQKS